MLIDTPACSSLQYSELPGTVFIFSISLLDDLVVAPHPAGYIWIETKHWAWAQISRFEAKASVKCIRTRRGIKRGGGTKLRDQRDWYVIHRLRWMEAIPEDECFIVISEEGRAGSDWLKRAIVSLCRLIDSICLKYFDGNCKLCLPELIECTTLPKAMH